jgi:hypothetical protein
MQNLDLFTARVECSRFHPIFAMLLHDQYGPERAVLQSWADGFVDRDGKFVQEFQMTFESGLWELYLYVALRKLGQRIDLAFNAPDFVVTKPTPFTIEATIAAPPVDGKPAHGYKRSDIPSDFNEFNRQATLRICNSFASKVKRYREYYSALPHVQNRPFVVAIAAFDRPLAHMAASRPILAALYGLYYDEEATIARRASSVVSYEVAAVAKNQSTDIAVGLFCSPAYADVSAVIYSSLATWGKVRALADNPAARTVYTTFHPNPVGLAPTVKRAVKKDYSEHLLDGLYVLHNPYAARPVPAATLSHERLAEIHFDTHLDMRAPDDFLLMRSLLSVMPKS